MLCPEVWNFKPPPSSTSSTLANNDREIRRVVENQYFNHCVSITIPDATHVHPSIQSVLSDDTDFYHVKDLPAFELVNPEFVELFVRKGELTLLSVGRNLDEHDCLSLCPTGKLIFSLRRKTFQELGIEGKPSSFSNKVPYKYVVNINLNDTSFQPGKKNHERVREMLKNKKDFHFDVILVWEPHRSEVCPSSIAAYIANLGYKVKTCSVTSESNVQYNVDIPVFDDESDAEILTEWLGAFNLGCIIPEKANRFVTTYETPEKHVNFGQVSFFRVYGLFTVTKVKKLFEEIREYAKTLSSSSWIGVCVNGYEDSVVNRGNQEHFFYSCGDYHYTVFYRQQGPPLLSVYTSSTRRPKSYTKKKRKS